MAANAVLLTGLKAEPDDLSAEYARYVELGLDVGVGRNRWKEDRPAARR